MLILTTFFCLLFRPFDAGCNTFGFMITPPLTLIACNHLTLALRVSCCHIGTSLGLTQADPMVVRLMGRWKSDFMIRYLSYDLSAGMLTGWR
jgi:hypothetical protein